VRDSRDSRVVMMAVAVEDGSSERQRQRRTMIAVEDNGMQDQAADYNGVGKEWVVREGKDRGVAMMDAAAEGGGGGQRWQRWTTTAMAEDDSSRRQRRRRQMMTARKIKRRTTRGKEDSRRQTTTALGQLGIECETK
jgi:hypothetical protein